MAMATPEPRPETVPLRPADVANQRFMIVKRGYDTDEVDAYLHQVSRDVERLQGEVKWLRSRAEHLERRGSTAHDAAYTRLASEFIAVMRAADEAGRQVLDAAEDEARTMLDSASERTERSIADAEQRSTATLTAAEQRSSELLASAEQRSTELVTTAEARSVELVSTAEARARDMVASAEARATSVLEDAERRAVTMLAEAREEADEVGAAARRAAEEVIANWPRSGGRRYHEVDTERPAATEDGDTADVPAEGWPEGPVAPEVAFDGIDDEWATRIWGAEGAVPPGHGDASSNGSAPPSTRVEGDPGDDLDLGFDGPLFDQLGPDGP
jgi:DivIVA domain-containing protein